MNNKTSTQTATADQNIPFSFSKQVPGLLIAYAPSYSCSVDRCRISPKFVVGRDAACDLAIRDSKLSKSHFQITSNESGTWIEDLQSTNGTYINGSAHKERMLLPDQAVIRAGNAVVVYHKDILPFLRQVNTETYGFEGRFHASAILEDLHKAAISARHLLITGASGTGKELAARALCHLMGDTQSPLALVTCNAARVASQEEITSTLFGVAARFFSNVDARPGFIERADGGVLFIDEVHNLPVPVQRSLLRVMEDGQTSRLGETSSRSANVRFILASNADGETNGLASDLFARLRRISMPSLNERLADIPELFQTLLSATLDHHSIGDNPFSSVMTADHFEALCLADYAQQNVRAVIDVCDRLVTGVKTGDDAEATLNALFAERFQTSPVVRRSKQQPVSTSSSRYEAHKDLIIETFISCGHNFTATEKMLKAKGFNCSRRWLSKFIEKWNVRHSPPR